MVIVYRVWFKCVLESFDDFILMMIMIKISFNFSINNFIAGFLLLYVDFI